LVPVRIDPLTQARPSADQCLMGDLHRWPSRVLRSRWTIRHQEPRARTGKLIDNLAQRRLVRYRRSGAGILLAFPWGHQPKKKPARGLLIIGRKVDEGPLRREPDRFPHAARARISIASHDVSFAECPSLLERELQEGQHALVLARLVEDARHQTR